MNPVFPGMNPYLESPYYWPGFHNKLIFCIHEELNMHLPAGYIADIEQRLAILPEDNYIRADISVTTHPITPILPGGGIAIVDRGAPTGIAGALADELYEWFIEVRTGRKDRRVVAIIEVLSPSNKAVGSLGWKDYKEKQHDLRCSDTHLMEIDLLRFGAHTVAAPLQELPPRDQWDYIVSLYRAPDRRHFPYGLVKVSDPLPEVQVPLLNGDADVILDLQSAFQHAFRAGRYADDIDFTVPPPSA
jgi:Protein of unknown function (DUF4058)